MKGFQAAAVIGVKTPRKYIVHSPTNALFIKLGKV
jgi:hypothetical protein